MYDYTALQTTVVNLIDKFGRSVTLNKHSLALGASDWKGTRTVGSTLSTKAIELPMVGEDVAKMLVDMENYQFAKTIFLVAHDSGYDVASTTQVVDGSQEYGTVKVGVLQPGDTPLLYIVGVAE